jgi:hypothetical protein
MNLTIPSTIMDILLTFSLAFSNPSFENFVVLFMGAILSNGSRTVTNMLRSVFTKPEKHFGSYHRFLNRACWDMYELSRILCLLLFALIPGTIELVVDETLSRHCGAKVYGKSCHRDKIRSTKKRIAYTYGHEWIVLAVQISMPFLKRPWSLPIMAMLWLSEKNCKQYRRKHRTPIELTLLMLRKLHHWFPYQRFILSGDGGYASLDLAAFCHEAPWLDLVSRLRKDAQLYELPPAKKVKSKGRPALKGKRLASPQAETKRKRTPWLQTTVAWYGGQTKHIHYRFRQALLYQPGRGTVLIAYVVVFDPQKQTVEAFYTTDLSLSAPEIIRLFVARWSIEVTFEEAKKYLALESTRNRSQAAVTRSFPLLLGLFSFIAFWYFKERSKNHPQPQQQSWYPKAHPTFQDAFFAIRQELWSQSIFSKSRKRQNMTELPDHFIGFLAASLAKAA